MSEANPTAPATETPGRATPPGRKSIEELTIEIERGELAEGLDIEMEELDDEEAQLVAKLAQVRMNKKIKEAAAAGKPEVGAKWRELESAQRRVVEGQRWIDNKGQKVEKAVKKLDEQVKDLTIELKEASDRLNLLKQDNGKTFGTKMQEAAQVEVDKLREEVETLFADADIEVDLDEVLPAIR